MQDTRLKEMQLNTGRTVGSLDGGKGREDMKGWVLQNKQSIQNAKSGGKRKIYVAVEL